MLSLLTLNQWNNIDTVTFTVVEAGVGIVCACLPATAPLYAALMQRLGLMSGSGVADHYYESNVQRTGNHRRGLSRLPKSSAPGGRTNYNYDSDLEFKDLIADSKFQAWSPTRDQEMDRSSATLQRPGDAIFVENKFHVSTQDTKDSRY